MTAEEENKLRAQLAVLIGEADQLSRSGWIEIRKAGALAIGVGSFNAIVAHSEGARWLSLIGLFVMGVVFGGSLYRFGDQAHRDRVTKFLAEFRTRVLDSIRAERQRAEAADAQQ